MARPPIENRDAVKGTIFTMKLTATDRDLLRQIVAQREAELATLTGQRIELAASAFVRWLFAERARHVGLSVEVPSAHAPAPAAAPSPPRKPAPSRSRVTKAAGAPNAERVRGTVAKLVEGGTMAKDLAAAAGVDPGALSKFRKGGTLGEAKLVALAAACSKLAG